MARIHPSDISRLALAGKHSAELETLGDLQKHLPQDYTVFHSVHWCNDYQRLTRIGEVDFVVVNREGGVLIVEQKNGVLMETDYGLYKEYGDRRKEVRTQVHRSMDNLEERFENEHGKERRLHLDYLIYCPDYQVMNINAAGLHPDRLVDAAAQGGLVERIQSQLPPGSDQDRGWREKVEGFFAQSFHLVPDIHAHLAAQERCFVRQTGPLVEILANLEMDPYRLRVAGTAGSGKSLIARQFYDRTIARGRRPLMVCFNRLLAEKWKAQNGKSGYANTYYGLCDDFLKSRGRRLDFSRMKEDPRFWQDVQEQVTVEDIPNEWRFDALVVDEGQDFEQEWYEILRLFVAEDSDVLWLEDTDQNLYAKEPVVTDGFVRYRCATNYRSPDSIARFIRKTLPFEFESGNDLPGLHVGVHAYASEREQPRIVGSIVQKLVQQQFAHEDIVILTCKGQARTVFAEVEKVSNFSLRRFTGEFDPNGTPIMTEGRVVFDTVRRFKGKEAPAVIVVDVDPDPARLDQSLKVLFCGMTRATVRLEMVVDGQNPENRRFLDAV